MNEHIEELGGQEMFSNELKDGCLGMLVGAVGGGIIGFYIGERLNDYNDILRESPRVVQYGLDLVTTLAGVAAGSVVGNYMGKIAGILRS